MTRFFKSQIVACRTGPASASNGAQSAKIVITGATGYVGRNIVPLLKKGGSDILLVGRDMAKIAAAFPGCRCCEYADLPREGRNYMALVHLAALNNNAVEPLEAFLRVNVATALETAERAREAGIETFVNVTSTHALDLSNTSSYAVSKRWAAAELRQLTGIKVINIYLPYVYNPRFSDRLAFLGRVPAPIGRFLFHTIASLKPIVSVDRVARTVEVIGTDNLSATMAEPAIISDGQADNPVYAFLKRGLDLFFALSVAVFFWWLLILIWALIRLESRGPGIFAQERVGQNESTFTCYKFRTMKTGTANMGTHEVSATSVTRLGAILRKLKLDELPQIINIFRNEISLVGPRPCLPVQTQLVQARRRLGVLKLKPGLSGLAQVNGIDMSNPEKLAQWDAHYMALQSLHTDLKIIIATALGRGNGDRVIISGAFGEPDSGSQDAGSQSADAGMIASPRSLSRTNTGIVSDEPAAGACPAE